MQAHAGALHQLANSTHQRNYDHIFASIPTYDGSNREEFFPWLDRLEAACYYYGRDIKQKHWEGQQGLFKMLSWPFPIISLGQLLEKN